MADTLFLLNSQLGHRRPAFGHACKDHWCSTCSWAAAAIGGSSSQLINLLLKLKDVCLELLVGRLLVEHVGCLTSGYGCYGCECFGASGSLFVQQILQKEVLLGDQVQNMLA
jgi:hypothetical protein